MNGVKPTTANESFLAEARRKERVAAQAAKDVRALEAQAREAAQAAARAHLALLQAQAALEQEVDRIPDSPSPEVETLASQQPPTPSQPTITLPISPPKKVGMPPPPLPPAPSSPSLEDIPSTAPPRMQIQEENPQEQGRGKRKRNDRVMQQALAEIKRRC